MSWWRRRLAMTTIVIGAMTVSLSACTRETPPAAQPIPTVISANATVERVVDGDTVIVHIDGERERVRLIGIDTPEIAHDAYGDRPAQPDECYGPQAHEFTASLLAEGTPVRLERDLVPRDDYGRLLAYVYRASDGVFVNWEIVRHGYAEVLTIEPNSTYADRFVDAARTAEADNVGLWAACSR